TAFIDAVNRGDREALSNMLPETEGSFEQALAGNFGLIGYGAFVSGSTAFNSSSRNQVLNYLQERHQHDDQQQLNTLQISPSHAPDSVDIVFNLTREADDMEPTEFGGKGAIDCQNQTIYLWVMDDGSAPA
ncbi:MAG: hypothetical protein M9890_11450, partial [Thermomicrobiales bacterium]|nr:hypothetical protein [Thermomicrobiales bacterium]